MTNQSSSERSIFESAIEKDSPEARAAFLDQACAGNQRLRADVEALLAVHDRLASVPEAARASESATTVDESITERPGTVIGPYKLLEQIGEGGMGVVFMAEQQQPIRRKVALKVLKPGMDTRQVIARFEAEQQALALMDHPNIAKVLDAGQTYSGRPYFVMDLVKGVPITYYCDQNNLNVRERLELFVHVCQAVQHAHQKGIIHRDIKPSNVLVTMQESMLLVKVIDFGIAKALGQQLTDKTVFTGFAQLVGTPLYMSPEQAALSTLDVDTRSDIYSLGVLLYELLTGTTPFDRERLKEADYDELRRIIREEEPPKPSTRISMLGQAATIVSTQRKSDPKRLSQLCRGELDWIVIKALEKDRNRRYETASALAADVRRYLNDEPVQACPPSAWYQLRKLARRNKKALAVVGLILFFVALLGGGGGWVLRDRAARLAAAEESARVALEDVTSQQEKENWPEALSAARRAQGILAGVEADPGLRQQVEELAKDMEMVCRLEELRLRPASATIMGDFDFEGCHAAYAEAFQWYGLGVEELNPQEAAQRMRSRPIWRQLATALDDWTCLQRTVGLNDWKPLMAVARAVDPDPWRDRLRDAMERKEARNPKALQELAASLPADVLPPATAVLLARLAPRNAPLEQVINVLQKVRQRHPADFWVNYELAEDLLRSRPPRLEEALRYYTAAEALRPHWPTVHVELGLVLYQKGLWDEAIAENRAALLLKHDDVVAHNNLGLALYVKGRLDEAIAEYREALRIKNDYVPAHLNLGLALRAKGQLGEAIAEFREALRIEKDCALAQNNLLEAEQMAELTKRLPAVLQGKDQPKDAAERLAFARLCQLDRKQYVAAASFYAEAFAAEPKLAEGLYSHRYNAACAAALAGCGQGQDAGPDAKERARLRRQALDWLRAELEAWGGLLDKGPDKARAPAPATQVLRAWLADPDFAGVRGPEALAKLPGSDRQAWQQLWNEVTDMLGRAQGQTASEKKSEGK